MMPSAMPSHSVFLRRPLAALNRRLLAAVLLAAIGPASPAMRPAQGEEIARVVSGVKSAQELRGDVQLLVSDLAGKSDTFDELVDPFLETLLFGVDTTKPHRFDMILSTEELTTLMMLIPLSDEDEFIEENLEPVGINVRRKRRTKGAYTLNGNVYEGDMVIADDYAQIAREEDYFPKSGSDAERGKMLAKLLNQPNWDLAVHIGPESGSPEVRARVADAITARRKESMERAADESPAAFALKQVVAAHSGARLKRLLSGAETVDFKYEIDRDAKQSRSTFVVVPGASGEMEANLAKIGSVPFLFSGVAAMDDAILSARLQWMMTDKRRARLAETLEAALPVAREQVAESDATPAQKDARNKLNELVYRQLSDNTTQDALNLFGEIVPASGGTYAGVMGSTIAGTEKIDEALDLFVAGYDGAKVEKNVGTMQTGSGETVTLHRVTMPELAPSLAEFFGTRTGLLGVSDKAVYAAAGEGAEEKLKAVLGSVSGDGEPTMRVSSFRMNAAPIGKLLNKIASNNEASLIDFFRRRRMQRNPNAERRVQVGDPEAFRRVFIEALERGGDDTFSLELKSEDGKLIGDGFAGEAVLRGVGEVIAKFFEDNFA